MQHIIINLNKGTATDCLLHTQQINLEFPYAVTIGHYLNSINSYQQI